MMGAAEYALFVGLVQAVDSGRANTYIDALIDAGVSRYWLSNKSLAAIFQTAIQTRRAKEAVTFIKLLIESELAVRQQTLWAKKWQDARKHEAVSPNGHLIEQVRKDAAAREVTDVLRTTQAYMQNNPRDILVWLPTVIQSLRGILETGQRYDPRPSAIWESGYVPQIVAKFNETMDVFNEMLGGGLWNGCLAVYGAPTSQGKSTFAYTMIAHAVAGGHKTVLFSREASAAEATARIVQAYGGFSRTEVESKQGSTPERHRALMRGLRELDRYVSIYDRQSAALGDFGEIVHWEQPKLAIVDHLALYGMGFSAKGLQVMGKRDPLGETAEMLRDLSRKERCTIVATSPFSSQEQSNLLSTHDLNPPRYYGSMRIAAAADFCYIAMRDWRKLNQAWIKCKKDRAEGSLVGREWYLGYDGRTRSYYQIRTDEPEELRF